MVVPISVEGPSKVNKGKQYAELKKKVSKGTQTFSYLFEYKWKAIMVDQFAFESCGVAYNMFTQATLSKDEETLNMMSDIELRRDGFVFLLK
ncbi:hypothetical protein LguiB_026606 [Lonicera macranthoides]